MLLFYALIYMFYTLYIKFYMYHHDATYAKSK